MPTTREDCPVYLTDLWLDLLPVSGIVVSPEQFPGGQPTNEVRQALNRVLGEHLIKMFAGIAVAVPKDSTESVKTLNRLPDACVYSGSVLDRSAAVLAGATLTLSRNGESQGDVLSAADGSFSFPPLPFGAYDLEVQLAGYEKLTQQVEFPQYQGESSDAIVLTKLGVPFAVTFLWERTKDLDLVIRRKGSQWEIRSGSYFDRGLLGLRGDDKWFRKGGEYLGWQAFDVLQRPSSVNLESVRFTRDISQKLYGSQYQEDPPLVDGVYEIAVWHQSASEWGSRALSRVKPLVIQIDVEARGWQGPRRYEWRLLQRPEQRERGLAVVATVTIAGGRVSDVNFVEAPWEFTIR